MNDTIDIYDFVTHNLLVTLNSSLRLEKGDVINIQGIDWKVDSLYFAVDKTLSARDERVLRMIVFCTEIRNA